MSRSGRQKGCLESKELSIPRPKEQNRGQVNNKFKKSIISLNKKGNNIIKR
jgi:hypothetical protein